MKIDLEALIGFMGLGLCQYGGIGYLGEYEGESFLMLYLGWAVRMF